MFENPHIGAVAPIINEPNNLYEPFETDSYQSAAEKYVNDDSIKISYSLGIPNGTFLLRGSMIGKNGEFDEHLKTQKTIEDYLLRSILQGEVVAFCMNALFFSQNNGIHTDGFESCGTCGKSGG